MTPMQYAAIQALAGAAALSVLFFDKRDKTHKPLLALLAYLLFVQMSALVIAAHFRLDKLTDWLLILTLAVHTGSILLVGGNVGKIHTVIDFADFRLPEMVKKVIDKISKKRHEY